MTETPTIREQNQDVDNLRACVTVRCSGKLHKVGLAHGGQFILFDHDKHEIERHLTMTELGSAPVRCISLYMAWMNGTINHTEHPRELSQYRFSGYEFAGRIQRKLRRCWLSQRLNSKLSQCSREQLIQEYKTLIGPALTDKQVAVLTKKLGNAKQSRWQGNIDDVASQFKIYIVEELIRRGWPTDKQPASSNIEADNGIDDEEEGDCYDPKSPSRLFSFSYRAISGRLPHLSGNRDICHVARSDQDNIKISNGNYEYISSFKLPLSLNSTPLQLAADVAEIGYINEIVRNNRAESNAGTFDCFSQRAMKLCETSGIHGAEVEACRHGNGTLNLVISHDLLTPAAAQLLIDAYRTIEPKIRAILSANMKRLRAKNRFPTTPEERVVTHGGVPKSEKVVALPCAVVHEEKVSNDNDDKDDII